jgi:hypothetical protein
MSKALVMACHLLVFGARRTRHTTPALYHTVRDSALYHTVRGSAEDAVSGVQTSSRSGGYESPDKGRRIFLKLSK